MREISWWRTSFGNEEVERLRKAVAEEHISEGTLTRQLEQELAQSLGVPHTVMTTSGSSALLLALMALGIGRDDEVLVPNRTWIATAHAVLMTGAKAVLVDVCPDIPVMDASKIKEKITSKTKAILPVHLNGRSVDMQAIEKIAKEYVLLVVEDAAQALYSKNSKGFLGTQSNAGCFSLGISKLISTGQGGFVVTRNPQVYEKLKLIKNHGVVDIFTDTWNQMGFNFKFTDLLASFGLVQMTHAEERIKHLKELYARYSQAMKDLPFLSLIPVKISEGEFPLYIEVLCKQRKKLIEFLKDKGIQTRPVPPNLSISGYLEKRGTFPNSERFGNEGIYLPCGPAQPLENVEAVIKMLNKFKE